VILSYCSVEAAGRGLAEGARSAAACETKASPGAQD